ncbi:MAG: hypothetical protein ACUVQ3_02280 [bacterium]
MSKARLGIVILFAVLFLSQCITMPAMYETAETKQEKRRGVSVQYGDGCYTVFTTTRYYYAGARVDYARSKRFGKAIEAGYEIGGSIIGYKETSSDERGVLVQFDGRPSVKLVTPTEIMRLGLKFAPGLFVFGCIAHQNTGTAIGGAPFVFSYASLLFGIGSPEFLTMSLNFPFVIIEGHHLYPKILNIGLTSHYKNTSVNTTFLFPHFTSEETEDRFRSFSIGIGWHY